MKKSVLFLPLDELTAARDYAQGVDEHEIGRRLECSFKTVRGRLGRLAKRLRKHLGCKKIRQVKLSLIMLRLGITEPLYSGIDIAGDPRFVRVVSHASRQLRIGKLAASGYTDEQIAKRISTGVRNVNKQLQLLYATCREIVGGQEFGRIHLAHFMLQAGMIKLPCPDLAITHEEDRPVNLRLNKSEMEVALLVAEGNMNKTIAEIRQVSVKTVARQLLLIYRKMRIVTGDKKFGRSSLVPLMFRLGMLPPSAANDNGAGEIARAASLEITPRVSHTAELCSLQGYTKADAAQQLGITESCVKDRIGRLYQSVRNHPDRPEVSKALIARLLILRGNEPAFAGVTPARRREFFSEN